MWGVRVGKNVVWGMLALVGMLLGLPAEAAQVELSAAERAYIQNNPVIRVTNELSWPPFNFNERGVAKGYSVDYIRQVADKVGLEVEFVSGPTWSEFLDMARLGEVDVVLNIVNTAKRREYILFTNPYVISSAAIYTRSGRSDIKSLKDLMGRAIAVPSGFFSQEILVKKYPGIKLYLTRNSVEALKAVAEGRADAVVSDTGVAEYLIRKHDLAGLKNAANIVDPMFVNVLGLGVPKDRPLLRDILQKGMDAMSDQAVGQLRERWLSAREGVQLREPLPFSPEEKAFLSARDDITMCIDPDWLPYEKFDASGHHIGMSADYFDVFSLRIGKPVRVIPTRTWSESLQKARARECDILSLAMQTPERHKYLNFTAPYVISPMVIATRPNAPFVPDIPSIGANVVGVVRDYAFVSVFRDKYPNVHVVEVNSVNEGLELVRDGKLFGMVGTLTTIGHAIQTHFVGELKISGKFEDTLDLSIGVRKDSPELLSIFNKAIADFTPEQHRAIANSWVAVHYREVQDYTLIIQLAGVFVVIAIFLAYRQVQLRRYNTTLERLSTTDRLTGLYNRLKLDEMLELRHGEFERFERHFSVVMLDIDHFKPINDKFGHQVGDKVLIRIGDVIKNHVRGIDSVGRWGGEEFLIICPETHAEGAMVLSEHIRGAMKTTDFAIGREVTVSLGVAEIRLGEGVKDLIARADEALYKAKQAGRDHVVVAEME